MKCDKLLVGRIIFHWSIDVDLIRAGVPTEAEENDPSALFALVQDQLDSVYSFLRKCHCGHFPFTTTTGAVKQSNGEYKIRIQVFFFLFLSQGLCGFIYFKLCILHKLCYLRLKDIHIFRVLFRNGTGTHLVSFQTGLTQFYL